jgi:hypothetical protein
VYWSPGRSIFLASVLECLGIPRAGLSKRPVNLSDQFKAQQRRRRAHPRPAQHFVQRHSRRECSEGSPRRLGSFFLPPRQVRNSGELSQTKLARPENLGDLAANDRPRPRQNRPWAARVWMRRIPTPRVHFAWADRDGDLIDRLLKSRTPNCQTRTSRWETAT